MGEAFLVNDEQAFQQLSGNSLRLTLGPLYLQIMVEVAAAYVFHCDMNVVIALIPPAELHEQSIMLQYFQSGSEGIVIHGTGLSISLTFANLAIAISSLR